jgi:hypothetical protein
VTAHPEESRCLMHGSVGYAIFEKNAIGGNRRSMSLRRGGDDCPRLRWRCLGRFDLLFSSIDTLFAALVITVWHVFCIIWLEASSHTVCT